MSRYVDGEEEQLRYTSPFVEAARSSLAKMIKRPIPDAMTQLLFWLARESFRLGYQHAHDRSTLRENLWPEEEKTK